MTFVLIAVISFVICVALTWVVRDLARKAGLVCQPALERNIHRVAVPRLGGIAIFITVAAVSLTRELMIYGPRGFWDFHAPRVVAIFVAGAIVFIIGLADDLWSVKPITKIAGQTLAASVFFLTEPRIWHAQGIFGQAGLGTVVSLVAAMGWLILVSNGFNLIDGLDGLAAGVALCAAIALLIMSLFTHHHFIAVVTSSLAGAIGGFLIFNFNPATIFLGDCGSLFLGIILAELALSVKSEKSLSLGVWLGVAFFALPLIDTSLAIVRRLLNGRPLFSADGEHIHHRLLQRGLSQRQIVFLLCGVSLGFSLVAFIFVHTGGVFRTVVFCAMVSVSFIALRWLGFRELDELHQMGRRVLQQKRIAKNDLELRRATERLQKEPSISGVCRVLANAFENSEFDSFTLELAEAPPGASDLLSRTSAGSFTFGWRKAGVSGELGECSWRMDLELSSTFGPSGALTIRKHVSRDPLLLDLEILTNDLRRALSEAVERAFTQPESGWASAADDKHLEVKPLPSPELDPEFRFDSRTESHSEPLTEREPHPRVRYATNSGGD
jgi:UDP-GlcNAc:undecaprenyl-phosphate/decaprenyl-phosphate GlcNAc-1-phosphate transferase